MSAETTPNSSPQKKKPKTSLFKSPKAFMSGMKSKLGLVGEVDKSRKDQASSGESDSEAGSATPVESGSEKHHDTDTASDGESEEKVVEAGPSSRGRTKNLVHSKSYLPNREELGADLSDSDAFKSAHETEEDEISDEEEQQQKSKRQSYREKLAKKSEDLKFVKDDKKRTQLAKERGSTLQKKAGEFATLTGGKVFLKAEYFSTKRNKPYTFQYGQEFALSNELVSPNANVGMEEMIKRAVSEGLKTQLENKPSKSPVGNKQSLQTPKSTNKGKPRRPAKFCYKCEQEDNDLTLFDTAGNVTQVVPTTLLACGYEKDGKYCDRLVHADCLGFPGVTAATIESMPDWYCAAHKPHGRKKTIPEPDDGSKKGKRRKKKV